MLSRILATVIFSALASTASAAEFRCLGRAEAEVGQSVEAVIAIADDGTRTATVYWSPRAVPEDSFGFVTVAISRSVADIRALKLGPFTAIIPVIGVKAEDAVGDSAVMIASTDLVAPVAKTWTLFGQLLGQTHEPNGTVAVVGGVPFTRDDDETRGLVESLAGARSLIVSAHDMRTLQPYAKGLFLLDDDAAVEDLMRAALTTAVSKAETPSASCDVRPPTAAPLAP
ncbi:hypothetical protein [Phenylobacterium sp.]|uniref:hypothetical protein n=1 Tax=Phenylobacterium sp. TaxID=1871053 RepID=UPI002731E5FE|nr:hypothetical protein [Phenylobacterium sp.]MDP1617043.1 hypothetical protein [Phenylobacterium sp.]MDP1988234.1 hypothetical protein [Phenylobacterium sp.]